MYNSPIIWSDSSQFSADTILIFMQNDAIDRIELRNKGFIINTNDSIYFNQIKGKLVEVFFVEGQVDSMSVEGNAESIYFMLDEQDAYIGMNKSICGKMSFTFEDNDLKDIFFHVNVNSNLIPIQDVNPNDTLEGFNWKPQLSLGIKMNFCRNASDDICQIYNDHSPLVFHFVTKCKGCRQERSA